MTNPRSRTFRRTVPLLCLVLAGCIFGDKQAKNVDENNENSGTNNAASNNAATNNGTANNTAPDMGAADLGGGDVGADVGEPDMASPDEIYAPLSATEVACPNPGTWWFSPSGTAGAVALSEGAAVAAANAPRFVMGLSLVNLGDLAFAYAANSGGSIEVAAVVGAVPDGQQEIAPILTGRADLGVDAEIFNIYIQSGIYQRPTEAGVRAGVATITVATSDGLFDCALTTDSADAGDLSCMRSTLDAELDPRGLRPSRVDYAPVFSFDGSQYMLNFLALDVLALVTGPTADGEEIAALRRQSTGVISDIALSGLPATVQSPAVYMERTVWGVSGASFGFPTMLALAEADGGLAPISLTANDVGGNQYTAAPVPDWGLSSKLFPERGTFTFVDGYDVDLEQIPLGEVFAGRAGYRFVPGEATFGYVGIAAEGLVFGRPGGFVVADYLELALADAAEIAAFKNIPEVPGADGVPPIAVIHGANRDQIALFNWGFGIDATWIRDILSPGITNARGMNSWWFWDDAGHLPIVAERAAELVVAVVPVRDIGNLAVNCQ